MKQSRSFEFFAAATAALLATTQIATAAKADPAIVSAVASASTTDIESVVGIAIAQGNAIAANTIKLNTTNVNALAAGLSTAIAGRTTDASNPLDPNRTANKVDEIGETAAFLMHAIAGNRKVTKLGNAKKYSLAVLQRTLRSTISLSPSVVTDVVGSVALTLHNDSRLDGVETKLTKFLTKSASKIAGKANASAVSTALAAGFAGDVRFEDGNTPALAVSDPETDIRNG